MEVEKDVSEFSLVKRLASIVIGATLAVTMLPIIRDLLSTTDILDTSMAIISPEGKAYFLPDKLARRIVRRQKHWSFARLTRVTGLEAIMDLLKGKEVYKVSPTW